MRLLPPLFLLALAGVLTGQANPGRVLVLVQRPGLPASTLHEVDLTTGQQVALPRFASDNLAPLAIAVDPATREPVVALAAGPISLVLRLHLVGQQLHGETVLAALPGAAVGMTFPSVGDLFVAVDGQSGGVYRVARQGGAQTLLWAAAGISALSEPVVLPQKYWVAQDQSPAAPLLAQFLDSAPTAPAGPPIPLTWLLGARLTGVHEFVSSGRVQMVADTQGRVHTMRMPNPQSTWAQVPLLPAILPGGARRLKAGPDGRVLALGGSADPMLKSFPQTTPQAPVPVTVVGTPFGDDPVDFAVVGSATARVVRFGAPCTSPAGPSALASGLPQIGNSAFALGMQGGLPNTYALLVVGRSERQFAGLPLPFPLGSCALLVSADLVLAQATDNLGAATQPLPIPASSGLAGQILHVQWWQDVLVPRGSDGLAVQMF